MAEMNSNAFPKADPATQTALDASAGQPAMHEAGVDAARQAMRDGRVNDIDPPQIGDVVDDTIAGPGGDLSVRRYYPGAADESSLPTLLYFHGGGFVIGDLDTHDNICRVICQRAKCLVVSVDYRLAPEHRYPAAAEDAIAAIEWAVSSGPDVGADLNRLCVGGDSAGGTLAAVAAQHAREKQIPIAAQILFYPVVDLDGHWPSHDEHANTPPISRPVLDWFWAEYFGPDGADDRAKRRELLASPINATSLAGLAPAFVLTAGLDPLRDEGKAYADRLIADGVETVYMSAMGTVHGFLRMGRIIPATMDALEGAATFLRNRTHQQKSD